MVSEQPFSLRLADLVWLVASVLALIPCLYYPYRFVVPYLGFTLAPDWSVRGAAACEAERPCLRVGDRVLAIDGITYEEFAARRTSTAFRAFDGPGPVAVRVLRDG